MSEIHILVVSSKYPPEYSGSGNRAHNSYKRLQDKFGISFDVLCSSVTENKNDSYVFEGVNVRRIAKKLLPFQSLQKWDKVPLMDKIALRVNYLSEAAETTKFLKQNHEKYDLVHVFGNVAVTSAAISFCNKHKIPLMVEITYDSKPQQYKLFCVKVFDKYKNGFHPNTQFVCISKKLEDTCRENGIDQPIWTRPNPVDTNLFFVNRENKIKFRNKNSKFKPNDIILVNVGKFMPLKNQIFLIDVLKNLPKDYKLVLAGPIVKDGPNFERDAKYMKSIYEKIKEYKLEDRVQIKKGFIENAFEYITMSDVYLLPSVIEGLGTPVIESICCGVPVVANTLKDVTDVLIKEGENGYLSDLNETSFAKKIELAVNIDERFLNNSAIQMQRTADVGVIDKKYFEIIQSMIGKSK